MPMNACIRGMLDMLLEALRIAYGRIMIFDVWYYGSLWGT